MNSLTGPSLGEFAAARKNDFLKPKGQTMRQTMKWLGLSMAMVLPAMALAGEVMVPMTKGPGGKLILKCPTGTQQMGGPQSPLEATLCVKLDKRGNRVFHGPYVVQYADGKIQSMGQYENHFRSGRWAFFDADGRKTGETEFTRGDYNGQRIELYPNGMKKLEERWVMGRRQGEVKSWDEKGQLTVVQYKDDKPIALR
ncbi:MAG: toxin-antitoxin system YwqK family antitoxin [Myxococcota bacterium]